MEERSFSSQHSGSLSVQNQTKAITNAIRVFIPVDTQPYWAVENTAFKLMDRVLEPCYNMPSHEYLSMLCCPLYTHIRCCWNYQQVIEHC